MSLIALIVIPIVAVVIRHHLQTHAKSVRIGCAFFESMMASRLFGMDVNTVCAANMIPPLYAKDKAVREKRSAFYGVLSVQNPSEDQLSYIKAKREALLKVMAKSLGYKDGISQQALDERYMPKGLADMAAMVTQPALDARGVPSGFVPGSSSRRISSTVKLVVMSCGFNLPEPL